RAGSVTPPVGRIPREIVEFFNASGGHSLIVKGPAGTGKTTFALQLTEELGEVAASHYLSSRVSDESLYRQFTWLKDRIKPSGLQAVHRAHRFDRCPRGALRHPRGAAHHGPPERSRRREQPERIVRPREQRGDPPRLPRGRGREPRRDGVPGPPPSRPHDREAA